MASGDELLPAVSSLQPDVLILDAHLPEHKVVETARQIRRQFPAVNILILSAHDRREFVVGFIRAGAGGYVLKDDSAEMLLKAVRQVAAGDEYFSPRVVQVLARTVRRNVFDEENPLTAREEDILKLMARGQANREIAGQLSITEQTVKNHVHNIYRKLGVDSRVEAVLWAINHGLGEVGGGQAWSP